MGWLMKKEGVEETRNKQQVFYDDRWYISSRPLYFYQKDIIDSSVIKHGKKSAFWVPS